MPQLIGGLDEVGTGAFAGIFLSVVAVFHDSDLAFLPPGVTDSKKVTEINREALYQPIVSIAQDIGVGHAWPWEIDEDPASALQLCYTRALADLTIKPDILLVDGSFKVRSWRGRQFAEPKADLKYQQVSAASIVAKVSRDRAMRELHKLYPQYGWDKNKGYGSADHQDALVKYGAVIGQRTPNTYIHRQRYCRNVFERNGK